MKCKNRNGFTLVETLAVLIILAVIAAAAVPACAGFIEKAKKNSHISEAKMAEEAVSFYLMDNSMLDETKCTRSRFLRQVMNICSGTLDAKRHPLYALMEESHTKGAMIRSVLVNKNTRQYFGIMYYVDGYLITISKDSPVTVVKE